MTLLKLAKISYRASLPGFLLVTIRYVHIYIQQNTKPTELWQATFHIDPQLSD